MPHQRKRHIQEPYDKIILHSKIIGIIGHRQVGKSTFSEAFSNEYCTLDERDLLNQALNEPKKFLMTLTGNRSVIDECQLAPALFPELKIRVSKNNKPGQFVLTGSVRFSSRKAIQESLTGRITNLELFPLVLTELVEAPNAHFFLKAVEASDIRNLVRTYTCHKKVHTDRMKWIDKYTKNGGLPGICFIRSHQVQANLIRDVLTTILDRDVRLVYPTSVPLSQLIDLCRSLAKNSNDIFRYSNARADTSLSIPTLRKLLSAFESIFLIRKIRILGDYKGELYWFEDQLEQNFLSGSEIQSEIDWAAFTFRNLRAQFGYRLGVHPEYFHYRSRGGAQVPLVIQEGRNYLGVFVLNSKEDITRSKIASAESFLKNYAFSKVVFLCRQYTHSEALSERMAVFSLSSALFE